MGRVNFADIDDQKDFDVLPAGMYTVQITNLTERLTGDKAQNPGARMLRWEFEVINNDTYTGRKVWDNQICTANGMWKIKALLNSLDLDTSTVTYDDEEQQFYVEQDGDDAPLDMDELVGHNLDVKVGIRPARKDPNTGRDYPAQNRVNAFYLHEASDADLLA